VREEPGRLRRWVPERQAGAGEAGGSGRGRRGRYGAVPRSPSSSSGAMTTCGICGMRSLLGSAWKTLVRAAAPRPTIDDAALCVSQQSRAAAEYRWPAESRRQAAANILTDARTMCITERDAPSVAPQPCARHTPRYVVKAKIFQQMSQPGQANSTFGRCMSCTTTWLLGNFPIATNLFALGSSNRTTRWYVDRFIASLPAIR
jgi:hypothetical protein